MSFASEKLYKGYLRRNMPTIVSKVKVGEILPHLPCLTDHDRETIQAKRETNGNFDGMMLLLDCLKRRENWPEQLIDALEACEHPTIAAKIRAEYDALRGINNSNPSLPSPTVVHVHPPPSASHLSTPESSGKSQATVALSAEASAPPEPVAQTIPPPETAVQPQATHIPAAPIPKAVTPPEPVPELSQSTQIEVEPLPSTPPPSPETQHTPASTPPLPQREVNAHQEPEENSESDIQDMTGDTGVIPHQVRTGQVNTVGTSPPSRPVEQSEKDTLSCSETLQTTTTITEVRPSPVQTNSDVTDRSSFPTLTPKKPPVQDTSPPMEKLPAVVLGPVETSEPQTTQVFESRRQTEMAATAAPLPGVAVVDSSLVDVNSVCLSKPAQLISIQPQNPGSHNIQVTSLEPYSGNSSRLEISDVAPDTVSSARVPTCSDASSTTGNTVSGGSCQENGNALNHSEPEENHYESPCESLESQVLVNVVHVSEEVSILNLDGQTSTPRAQIINSEAAKEIASASPLSTTTAHTVSSLNAQLSENYHPSEPASADISSQLPGPEESGASHILTNNTKFILGTAGVAALALLIAWKFKN